MYYTLMEVYVLWRTMEKMQGWISLNPLAPNQVYNSGWPAVVSGSLLTSDFFSLKTCSGHTYSQTSHRQIKAMAPGYPLDLGQQSSPLPSLHHWSYHSISLCSNKQREPNKEAYRTVTGTCQPNLVKLLDIVTEAPKALLPSMGTSYSAPYHS